MDAAARLRHLDVAGALGRAIPISEAVAKKTTHDSFQFDQRFGAGQDVFDAMTRLMEKRYGTDYKN